MQTTQRAQQLEADSTQKASQYMFIGGAFMVFGFSVVVFIVKPEMIRLFSTSASGVLSGPSWVIPTISIGIALGGSALSWMAVARFLKEVHVAPYAWTAPFLGLVAGAFIANTKAVLPFGFSPLAFAATNILLILAGGALSSMRGFWHTIFGVTLCILPTGFLLINLLIQKGGFVAALAQADAETQFLLFVLSITSLVIGALPFLPESGSANAVKLREELAETRLRLSRLQQQQNKVLAERDQLVKERATTNQASAQMRIEQENLQQHARRMQAKLVEAEQAAAAAKITLAQDYVDEAAALSRRGLSAWMKWTLAGVLAAAFLFAGYLQVYRPMATSQLSANRALVESKQKYAATLTKVNRERDAERARFEATIAEQRDELVKVRKQVVEAMEAAQVAKNAAPAAVTDNPSRKTERKIKAKAKPSRRASVQKSTRARSKLVKSKRSAEPPSPAKQTPTGVSSSDDPIGGLEGI